MEEAIKSYLEGQLSTDNALKEKYSAKRIGKCVEYVTNMARKELSNKNGYIPDEKVFHWAREYFVDGIADKEKDNEIVSTTRSIKKKLAKIDLTQLELDF